MSISASSPVFVGAPPVAATANTSLNASCGRDPRALDVLYITSNQTFLKDISVNLKNHAQSSGVPMELVYVEDLGGAGKEEKIAAFRDHLGKLHDGGKIDEHTQIIIHTHGTISEGPHHLSDVKNVFSISTREMVSVIRESGASANSASTAGRWNGTIHIGACGIARDAKELISDAGLTLLYGGSKAKLGIDSEAIFSEVIRQLGEYRKDPEHHPFPTAQQLYAAAGAISGEKVSLSGEGTLCQIRSGLLPVAADLHKPSVMDRLEKSPAAKLIHGKLSTVRKMLDLMGSAVQHIKFIHPL